MLKTINLQCVRGERSLFNGLSLRVEAGECLVIRGENGSGKTSLLRMLAGLAPPADGAVYWNGRQADRANEEYRRELLYLGHLLGLKEGLSAAENLTFASTVASDPASPSVVYDALHQAGLSGKEDLPVRALSQGQRRRVNLARLLLQKRALWVLDEPLTALDDKAGQWAMSMIDRHLAGGGVAVLTTHQDVALTHATQLIRMGT